MKTITAKFDSTCSKCHRAITAGERINYEKGKPVTHAACPTRGPTEFTLTGAQLRARHEACAARVQKLAAVVEDMVLERTGEEPSVCPHCQGTGVLELRWNASDTLDYSDWRTETYACGTVAFVAHDSATRNSWVVRGPFPAELWAEWVELARVQAQPGFLSRPWSETKAHYDRIDAVMKLLAEAAPVAPPKFNPACREQGTTRSLWRSVHADVTREVMETSMGQMLRGANLLTQWAQEDLQIRRGDIVTVLHRRKPYTGPVTWMGTSDYGGEARVTVDVDGKRIGGAEETAVLISRTVRL